MLILLYLAETHRRLRFIPAEIRQAALHFVVADRTQLGTALSFALWFPALGATWG